MLEKHLLHTGRIKIEKKEHMQWNSVIDDIEIYLNNNEEFSTMKQMIGHDMIFRGFIVKDWFRKDQNACKNGACNKATIKLNV